MEKKVVKSLLKKNPQLYTEIKKGKAEERLYLDVGKKEINVHSHSRKTKSGKLSLVKQYKRKINQTIKDFKLLKSDSIKSALNISKKYTGKQADSSIKDKFSNDLKLKVIKLLTVNLGTDISKESLKKKSQVLFDNVNSITDNIFNSKRLDVKWTNKTSHKEKSKYHFGYYGDGTAIDNRKLSEVMYEGTVLFNQNLNNEPWKDSLKRKDLKSIQFQKESIHNRGYFPVSLYSVKNGKITLKQLGEKSKEQIIKIIREGK